MSLFDFGKICFFWLAFYLIVKVVYWSLGLNRSKKQMICSKLRKLMRELSRSRSALSNDKKTDVRKMMRMVRSIRSKYVKVEKRFRIYMFDNPDSKVVETIRSGFVSKKEELSKDISGILSEKTGGYLDEDEASRILADLDEFYDLCSETNEKMLREIKRNRQREAVRF